MTTPISHVLIIPWTKKQRTTTAAAAPITTTIARMMAPSSPDAMARIHRFSQSTHFRRTMPCLCGAAGRTAAVTVTTCRWRGAISVTGRAYHTGPSWHGQSAQPFANDMLSSSDGSNWQQTTRAITQPERTTTTRDNNRNIIHHVTTTMDSDKHHYEQNILLERYMHLVDTGDVLYDLHQVEALQALERLRHDLMMHPPSNSLPNLEELLQQQLQQQAAAKQSNGFFSNWFASSATPSSQSSNSLSSLQRSSLSSRPPRGVYLHGGVGCGKSWLVQQLFYETLLEQESEWSKSCQKIHYYAFMLGVHNDMHQARQHILHHQHQQSTHSITNGRHPVPLALSRPGSSNSAATTTTGGGGGGGDVVLAAVVRNILQRGRLLCLDEFQVTDVADAMILKRLFGMLWNHGCVLVATSNRAPTDLYRNGIQRDRFLPFLDDLQQHCQVVSMWQSETDYRVLQKLMTAHEDATTAMATTSTASTAAPQGMSNNTTTTSGMHGDNNTKTEQSVHAKIDLIRHPVYFLSSSATAAATDEQHNATALEALFASLTAGRIVQPQTLYTICNDPPQGRPVAIPAATMNGVARFSFTHLCHKALGAADYLLIGKHFHTVIIDHVPVFRSVSEINAIRRFITLIDTMYECHVKLILCADAPVHELLQMHEEAAAAIQEAVEDAASTGTSSSGAATTTTITTRMSPLSSSSSTATTATATTTTAMDGGRDQAIPTTTLPAVVSNSSSHDHHNNNNNTVKQKKNCPVDLAVHYDEIFAFDRIVSRLEEMSSRNYLQKRWSKTWKIG